MAGRPSTRRGPRLTPLLSSRRALEDADSKTRPPAQNASGSGWTRQDGDLSDFRSAFEKRRQATIPRMRVVDDRGDSASARASGGATPLSPSGCVKLTKSPSSRTRGDTTPGTARLAESRSRQTFVDRLHPSPPVDLEVTYTSPSIQRSASAVCNRKNFNDADAVSRARSPRAQERSKPVGESSAFTPREHRSAVENGRAVVEQLVMETSQLRQTVSDLEQKLDAALRERDDWHDRAGLFQQKYEELLARGSSSPLDGSVKLSEPARLHDNSQGIRHQLADTLETLADLRTQMAAQRDQSDLVASLRAQIETLKTQAIQEGSDDGRVQSLEQEVAQAITKAVDAEMNLLVAREECSQSDARRCEAERRNDELEDRCRSLSTELSKIRKSSDMASLSGYGDRSSSPDSGRAISRQLEQQRDRFAEDNLRLRSELQQGRHVSVRETQKTERGQLDQRGLLLQELEELKSLRAELELQTKQSIPAFSVVKRNPGTNNAHLAMERPQLDLRSTLQRLQGQG